MLTDPAQISKILKCFSCTFPVNGLKCLSRKMSSATNCPWSCMYINGPDKPLYFRRVKSQNVETESRNSGQEYGSKVLNTKYKKYLLLKTSDNKGYIQSAIKSHSAYRQNVVWPMTLFCHCILSIDYKFDNLGSRRGVFCCCTSREHFSQVHSNIVEFLKENANFVVYEFRETLNKDVLKLVSVADSGNTNHVDDQEISIQLVDREALKDYLGGDSLASPIFTVPELSPVFHSYNETVKVLEELTEVPEVQELLDISRRYATTLTEHSLDTKPVHPFVVVEGMDATGKTTLTENLEKRMGAARYFTPPPKITHLRAFFDRYPEIVRRAFYSMGNYIVAGEIIKECQSRPVIMDRFWHSSAAYGIANETSSGDLPESDHPVYRWPSDLLKPTIVLFLTVSEDVRQQRLTERRMRETFEERSLDKDQLFRQRLCDAYRRMNKPSCVEIDSSGTREEVQNSALQVLKSHGVNLDNSSE